MDFPVPMHRKHEFRCGNTPGPENEEKIRVLIGFNPKNSPDRTGRPVEILKIQGGIVGNLLVINRPKKYRAFSIYSCAPVCFCALS
jgi:hypothetical protein